LCAAGANVTHASHTHTHTHTHTQTQMVVAVNKITEDWQALSRYNFLSDQRSRYRFK
jgi:hypothetical protein